MLYAFRSVEMLFIIVVQHDHRMTSVKVQLCTIITTTHDYRRNETDDDNDNDNDATDDEKRILVRFISKGSTKYNR